MSIPTLKQFTKQELLNTLIDCRNQLEIAYQETMQRDFWHASVLASFASEYLAYELHREDKRNTTH
jgi:hypothetical protein